VVQAYDDRLHRGEVGLDWFELVDLLFGSPQGALGGHLTVIRWPASGRAWYWAAALPDDGAHPAVSVLETDIALPAGALELRAAGLWADHTCETPLVHWSYGLEAFGLAVDDPAAAFAEPPPMPGGHAEPWGARVPLGFDLEWEAAGADPEPLGDGFAHRGRVHGEVLVGADGYDLQGWGVRIRRWGRAPIPLGLGNRLETIDPAAVVPHPACLEPEAGVEQPPGRQTTLHAVTPAGRALRVLRSFRTPGGGPRWEALTQVE
jgi:hypothetical protein